MGNNRGETARALEYYDKSLTITERIGDEAGAANTYFNLGNLYADAGNRNLAWQHYEKARALYEMLGQSQDAQDAARALQTL